VELIAELQSVLDSVQNKFVWESDSRVWSKPDHWETIEDVAAVTDSGGKVHGDCDQHALLCRQALRAKNIPNRLVLCLTELGECHLVCEVDGWILDNRFPRVTERDLLNYKWVAVSGFNAGDPWHEVLS